MEKSIKFKRYEYSDFDTITNYEVDLNFKILDEFYIQVNRDILDIGEIKIEYLYEKLAFPIQYYLINNAIDQISFYKDKNSITTDVNYDNEIVLKINLKKIYPIKTVKIGIYNRSYVNNSKNPEIYIKYNDNNYTKQDIDYSPIEIIGYIFGISKQKDNIFYLKDKIINPDNYGIIEISETKSTIFYKLVIDNENDFNMHDLKYLFNNNKHFIHYINLYDIEVKKI